MNRCRRLVLLACLLLMLPLLPAAGERYTLDFDYLRQFAPSAAGWLYQPGTSIDRPVLCSPDPYYYLEHAYDGQRSSSGSIYIVCEGRQDLSAGVITLRGKNIWNNTLFGSLSEYQEPAYYAQNPTLYLISPEGCYRLDIFAGIKTRHKDHESWVVTEQEDRFGDRLPGILENSFITPDPAFLPQEADAWAVLSTEDAKEEGSRFVLYARKREIAAEDAPPVYMNVLGEEARASVSGYATAEGVGTWMVYGQDDPLWDRMRFEVMNSSRKRPFGDGGCGPTSVAMAIANLVPAEKLPLIRQYATHPQGNVFCPCCIGDLWCDQGHEPYVLETPEEYLRYFPLAVADFALGNNTFGVQGRRDSYGTNMSYLNALCSVYGITVRSAKTLEGALPYLRRKDTMAIACVTGSYTPFTRNSHFLVLARVTNEHIYVLDPLCRESYAELDPRGIVEIISPGLVRVRLEDAHLCHFTSINLLTY